MTAALILVPLVAGLIALVWKSLVGRRVLLVAAAVVHLGLTLTLWVDRPELDPHRWLGVDTPGLLFLTITSVLFMASAIYTVGYLQQEYNREHLDAKEGFMFTTVPSAIFTGCLLLFLAAMTAVTLSQHYGLLWVSMEATTLASAPLIYFHKHHRSLEATWKYLLICSVGIALALLGNFLLAVSASGSGDRHATLIVSELLARASQLDPQWLKGAFLFVLVGYGTKMGLAPMHTALPDADSEAPPAVAALLSGALLNCAFLGIFRVHQLCVAAGLAAFSQQLLVVFGLLSMGVASVFIVRQADFRRMLAYSGIEHMGILAIGVGLGSAGVFAAMLHAFNHSLTKAALFFVSGNIFTAYDSKFVNDVRGVRRVLPISGILWIAGFLSITGAPPFGTFLSEFSILKAALDGGHGVVAAIYLFLLALIFIGMANIVLPMAQGMPEMRAEEEERERQGDKETRRGGDKGRGSEGAADRRLISHALSDEFPSRRREPAWSVAPPAVLMTMVLVLGSWIPDAMNHALHETADDIRNSERGTRDSALAIPHPAPQVTLHH